MRKARYWRGRNTVEGGRNNIQPALPRQQCVPIDDDGLEAPVKFGALRHLAGEMRCRPGALALPRQREPVVFVRR